MILPEKPSPIDEIIKDAIIQFISVSNKPSIPRQTNDPMDLNYDGDPQKAFQYEYRSVKYISQVNDKWRLIPSWLIPNETISKKYDEFIAIYVHGIWGSREDGYRFLKTLHDFGIATLMIEYRNDEPELIDKSGLYAFGLTENEDLQASIRYITQNYKRVILIGDSMGGAIVANTLINNTPNKVAACIFDAPALEFNYIVENKLIDLLPISDLEGAYKIILDEYDIDLSKANYIQQLAEIIKIYNIPTFYAYGTEDKIVPPRVAETFIKSVPPNIITVLKTKGDHLGSFNADRKIYTAALEYFLKRISTL
ncbi:alpha/beta hydrolase [Pseudochrobactrum sp. HB0163]|uniref:alpha/beta hydrolase n=1 Tax=Pseudochrobactrum sp. HB0163 TaxID=3450708 RepID=UPI003F6DD632